MWGSLKEHLLQTIVGASLLGGGTLLVNSRVELARQDERIIRIEESVGDIAQMREDVAVIRTKVETLQNEQSK